MFTENGYRRKTWENISENCLNELQNQPFTNKDNSEDVSKVVKVTWMPIIEPKLMQAFKEENIKRIFTVGSNLKSLLTRNKTKLLSNSYSGVYELKYTFSSTYFGETKKKMLITVRQL